MIRNFYKVNKESPIFHKGDVLEIAPNKDGLGYYLLSGDTITKSNHKPKDSVGLIINIYEKF